MRSAVLLLVAWLCLGCRDLAGMVRAHAYTVARNMGGVDTTNLMIEIDAPAGYPPAIVNPLALRAMLRRADHSVLDSLLSNLADSAHGDYHYETRLYSAYDAFEGDTTLGAPLDQWVQSEPSSAPAHIARASYSIDRGWHARGTAYAKNTSRVAMQHMNDLFASATHDLDSAIALTPRNAAAYRLLIQIAKVKLNNQHEARDDLMHGLEDIPASYGLRHQYMRDLIPRWGGSYDAMQAMVQWSEHMADTNPRLRALAGYITLDSAEMMEITGHRAEALALYSSALTQGDESVFHLERGQCLVRMRNYVAALPDLDAAVAEWPDAETYLWRGLAREGLMRTQPGFSAGALSDLQRAVLLDPSNDLALSSFMLLYTRAH